MNILLITDNQALDAFLETLTDVNHLCLDTEFMREHTYYPILGLIQAYHSGDTVYLIDPLAEGLDLTPFFDVLKRPDITKVFHSARQDYEIFYHSYGFLPAPLFDTQIVASVLGYGEQVSFESLVKQVTRQPVDKTQQRTDWLKRPLNEKQLHYAAEDVYYLLPIYETLQKNLHKNNRTEWIQEDINALLLPETYIAQEDMIVKKIKHKLTGEVNFSVIRSLALLREKLAQTHNRIRNHIFKDDILINIAEAKPTTLDDLRDVKHLSSKSFNQYGEDIIQAVAEGIDNAPSFVQIKSVRPNSEQEKLVQLLSLFMKQTAENLGIAPRLLASSSDITDYVNDGHAPFMTGWRYEIFGKDAEALVSGKLSLTYEDGKIVGKYIEK